jgi:hypothetical protein
MLDPELHATASRPCRIERSWHAPRTIRASGGQRACGKNVGANAFSLVAPLFWLYMLQPGRNMLVSGVRAIQVAPEQHVWAHRHNQTGII